MTRARGPNEADEVEMDAGSQGICGGTEGEAGLMKRDSTWREKEYRPHDLKRQSEVGRAPAYQLVGVAGEITPRISASNACFNYVFWQAVSFSDALLIKCFGILTLDSDYLWLKAHLYLCCLIAA